MRANKHNLTPEKLLMAAAEVGGNLTRLSEYFNVPVPTVFYYVKKFGLDLSVYPSNKIYVARPPYTPGYKVKFGLDECLIIRTEGVDLFLRDIRTGYEYPWPVKRAEVIVL